MSVGALPPVAETQRAKTVLYVMDPLSICDANVLWPNGTEIGISGQYLQASNSSIIQIRVTIPTAMTTCLHSRNERSGKYHTGLRTI